MTRITAYSDGSAVQAGDEFLVARGASDFKIAGNALYTDLFKTPGMLAATYDPRLVVENHGGTTGVLHGDMVLLHAGDVITAVGVFFTTAGSGQTLAKVGIYNASFSLVASSASDTTFGNTTGYHDLALSSTYTVPSTGAYYLADLYVGGTMPSYLAITQTTTAVSQLTTLGGSPFLFFQQLSQTDLPATATPAVSAVPHFFYAR